jgi:hypothetical protein
LLDGQARWVEIANKFEGRKVENPASVPEHSPQALGNNRDLSEAESRPRSVLLRSRYNWSGVDETGSDSTGSRILDCAKLLPKLGTGNRLLRNTLNLVGNIN